jgi:L-glyceraldehyde 3-phosphate reductase
MTSFAPTRYDRMTYRRCGRWGLKLPAISLGPWETFGGYRGEETARECMFRAFDLGITHFDLANNYGKPPGMSRWQTPCAPAKSGTIFLP